MGSQQLITIRLARVLTCSTREACGRTGPLEARRPALQTCSCIQQRNEMKALLTIDAEFKEVALHQEPSNDDIERLAVALTLTQFSE